MKRDYGVYHVALKILLKKGRKLLFLSMPEKSYFDLPGGRIDKVESTTPLKSVLAREVREELGENIQYTLGKPVFQFRRYFEARHIYIFITVYEATLISGSIQLSPEHISYTWIDPLKYHFKEKEFCSKEEYQAFTNYFLENYYK